MRSRCCRIVHWSHMGYVVCHIINSMSVSGYPIHSVVLIFNSLVFPVNKTIHEFSSVPSELVFDKIMQFSLISFI